MPLAPLAPLLALPLVVAALFAAVRRRLALEWFALTLTLAAVLAGWLTPAEALVGFANPATLTVAAMFVLSAGLVRSGGLAPIERLLGRLSLPHHWQQLLLLALVVGPLSAVISNLSPASVNRFTSLLCHSYTSSGTNRSVMASDMSRAWRYLHVASVFQHASPVARQGDTPKVREHFGWMISTISTGRKAMEDV